MIVWLILPLLKKLRYSVPMHEETVIIPHPNELKKLADLQRKLSAALSVRGETWMPGFPTCVRGIDGMENLCAGEKGLSGIQEMVAGCELTGLCVTENAVSAKASVSTRTGTLNGMVKLAEKLRENVDEPRESTDEPPCSQKDGTQKRVLEEAAAIFPLRLPVFRVAKVLFSQEGSRTEWTVAESKWIKTSRPEVQP